MHILSEKGFYFMSESVKHTQYFVSLKLQLFLMLITLIALSFIFYFSYRGFKSSDDYPHVISLTPQKIFELGGPAKPITVGIFVKNFSEFNVIKGEFLVDLNIRFKFNPDYFFLDQISKFTFQQADIKSKSEPLIRIEGNEYVVSYDMRVLFRLPLNYNYFPLDDHRLSFIVDNDLIAPSDGFFVTSKNNIIVSPEVHVEGWDLRDTSVHVGYFENRIQEGGEQKVLYHPRAVFLFDFYQDGIRYIFTIFLPLLMIFFTALMSFSVNPLAATFHTLVDMSGAALAALIGYRFVMETVSPVTGYFILSDYIFFYFLVAILFIFLVNMFGKVITGGIKSWIVIGLHITTVLVFFYFLAPWM